MNRAFQVVRLAAFVLLTATVLVAMWRGQSLEAAAGFMAAAAALLKSIR